MNQNKQSISVYTLRSSVTFIRNFKKLTRRNRNLRNNYRKTLNQLKVDPYYPSLKTYIINDPIRGQVNSSRITGDLRVIWNFDKDKKKIILLLATGGHSGGRAVYK